MSETEYPVHEKLDVVDGTDIFKTEDWWKAVVVCDAWDGNEINVYLWQNTDSGWKRKQKFKVNDTEQWESTKESIDTMVTEYMSDSESE